MSILSIFNPRVVTAFGFAAIVAVATAGFAASNTVPATQAGDGSGAITGYALTGVTYVLDAGDPSKIDTVKFLITGSTPANPATVKARIDLGAWTAACPRDGGGVYTCDLSPNEAASTAANLQVVAAQ